VHDNGLADPAEAMAGNLHQIRERWIMYIRTPSTVQVDNERTVRAAERMESDLSNRLSRRVGDLYLDLCTFASVTLRICRKAFKSASIDEGEEIVLQYTIA
jgi:hypothetical protein